MKPAAFILGGCAVAVALILRDAVWSGLIVAGMALFLGATLKD